MHVDLSVGPDRLMSLKQGQKINHMYGMLAICRKKSLFQSLSTMRKYVNFNKISSVIKKLVDNIPSNMICIQLHCSKLNICNITTSFHSPNL
jgi:hypothetical protein